MNKILRNKFGEKHKTIRDVMCPISWGLKKKNCARSFSVQEEREKEARFVDSFIKSNWWPILFWITEMPKWMSTYK